MTYNDMERELRHLEFVLGRITPADTVPTLGYWRSRLHSLRLSPVERVQRNRLDRLEQLLCALEYSVRTGMEASLAAKSATSSIRSQR
jgi:hypothetical protein